MTNFQYPTLLDRIKYFPLESLQIYNKFLKWSEEFNPNKTYSLSRLMTTTPGLEKRSFFNKKRNILVEASYKGACRSLDNLFGVLRDEWDCLNEGTSPNHKLDKAEYHQDILSSHDVEIHTLVRDPISRFASGIKFFARRYPREFTLMIDLDTLIKHSHLKYAHQNHLNPQVLGTFLGKGQEEFAQRYIDSMRQNYDRLLDDPSEFEECSMLMEPQHSILMLCCGWHANQHIINIADLKKSTKYYWVWDEKHYENKRLKESPVLAESFYEKNHMRLLIENLGLDLDEDHYLNCTTHKIGEHTGFSEDTTTYGIVRKYQDHFRLQKAYMPKEYEWIDSLHFENTPGGKPVYSL